jgi:hypothetical protein
VLWNIQLVFDCRDPDEIMAFWGPFLEYSHDTVTLSPAELKRWRKDYPQYDGRGRIDDAGGVRRMPIYIQAVPEPKVGRNRLTLEVEAPVDDDARLGAASDPEGNEYVVVAGDTDVRRLRTITFDALDPGRMFDFWSQATGYTVNGDRLEPPRAQIEDGKLVVNGRVVTHPGVAFTLGFHDPATLPDRVVLDLVPGIAFRKAEEPKSVKNRLHLDLRAWDRDSAIPELERLGATVQRTEGERYAVMQDPEGNEFCV